MLTAKANVTIMVTALRCFVDFDIDIDARVIDIVLFLCLGNQI